MGQATTQRLGIDLAAPHAALIAACDGVSRRLAMACGRYTTPVRLHADHMVLLVAAPT